MVVGVADHLEIWNTKRWADHDAEINATAAEIAEELAHGGAGQRREAAEIRGADSEMATLTYMPTEHVPVLASELIALLDPRPGETAVDCTFGGGGHARLVAERLGPTGMLVVHRPRSRGAAAVRGARGRAGLRDAIHGAELRGRPCRAGRRGHPRRPRLHGPGHLIPPARGRGTGLLIHLRRAARHAHGPRRGPLGGRGRQRVAAGSAGRRHSRARRGAPRPGDRTRDRPPPSAGDNRRPGRGDSRRGPAGLPLRARATPPSGPSRRSGSPSTRSWTRSTARCPRPGSCCATAGAWG